MTIRVDPEQNETCALFNFVDLDGRRVLEIGSGNGRLTLALRRWDGTRHRRGALRVRGCPSREAPAE